MSTSSNTLLRHEDLRLVTGAGRFTDDWQPTGLLHAVMVRSDHAHARIVSVDLQAAREMPGVVAAYSADDIADWGVKPIPTGANIKGVGGSALRKAAMPALATDRVRFVGQPVAMVVAESVNQARDAAEQVMVDYEVLDAVATPEAALAEGAVALHEVAPDNLSLLFENGDQAATDAAFAAAARTSKLRILSQRLAGAPMELRAVMANHDAERGKTVVYTPTQGMLGMRQSLAFVTGLSEDQFEIVAQDVGGSFGLRGGPGPEHALVVHAARRLGRPVKWVASRSELFIGEWHGRALVLEGEIALDPNDRITAIRFDDTTELGAYNCYFAGFIGTTNLSATMGGVYAIPALHMRSKLVFTNTVPVTAYRGAGRPDIAFAIERLVDHCAAEHGLDRVALRRKNFIAPDAFPYTTANGTVYDSGAFEAVLDHALKSSDYAGFESRRAQARVHGRLRGIGFGCYLEKSGAGASTDQVKGRFSADGKLTLYAVTGASGQGHETSFSQIVGDGLGIDPAGIAFRAGDPGLNLVGNGTGGSRSLYGAGSAFKQLVGVIIEHARAHAARHLGLAPDSLQYVDGGFSAGTARVGLLELARALAPADGSANPLDCDAAATSGATYPNGCHVAEIEIDPETGATEVLRYTAVDDLGNVVSPVQVLGQVQGGVVQGVGQAFGEHIVYDENAQLLSGSFMDYPMPRAGAIQALVSEMHPVPTKLNELGAKGVGESGCSGSLPAVSNAMMDALRSVGAQPIDMPYTPAKVWAAISGA